MNQDIHVTLVGAGPGDPELLTLKALRAIERAEVVVYDSLVSPDILALIPAGVKRIEMGKRCGKSSARQEDICAVLVRLARAGNRVVRLKGGDPFIFGRGGEEALYLKQHDIPFSVVPGITAALGCAAASLIPLTHRGVSRAVTLVTGHLQQGGEFRGWSALAQAGQTLVFYMGLEQATVIQQQLLAEGCPASLPVALIESGTTAGQRITTTELGRLIHTAERLTPRGPVLMMIGEVVRLRAELTATLDSLAVA
ncbi:uroporphyrinogen-III C-methyltransferase [Zobellella endophytica]|uniref:uroporphyrinogen-III C-methyltransferase n=1 Tax=Zobellella endophytica TaxID=2116700 RepID=A0A2P7QTY1_9GAMM|nr:uroporphyrinogen-III C-methyltransferase [Zobellella endophytica]PSJ41427.1 uroporphyrinogen-III C-methyltransferase [Zobellella endophytica]